MDSKDLRKLLDQHGVTFAMCVEALSEEGDARHDKIVEMARERHGVYDGETEIDDSAILSEGDDNGCYVMGWFWLPFDDTEFDTEKDSPSSGAASGKPAERSAMA